MTSWGTFQPYFPVTLVVRITAFWTCLLLDKILFYKYSLWISLSLSRVSIHKWPRKKNISACFQIRFNTSYRMKQDMKGLICKVLKSSCKSNAFTSLWLWWELKALTTLQDEFLNVYPWKSLEPNLFAVLKQYSHCIQQALHDQDLAFRMDFTILSAHRHWDLYSRPNLTVGLGQAAPLSSTGHNMLLILSLYKSSSKISASLSNREAKRKIFSLSIPLFFIWLFSMYIFTCSVRQFLPFSQKLLPLVIIHTCELKPKEYLLCQVAVQER